MTVDTLGRAGHAIATDMLGKIRRGDWPEGQQLPPERRLAEDYGVARNTVRLALRRLESEGLLIRHVGRGTFVRDGAGRRRVEGGGLSPRLRAASPADVMEVRLILEPRAAALAANRANADDLFRIQGAYRNSVAAKGLSEFEHWDAQLHLAIVEATKNAMLIDYCVTINAIRNEPAWYHLKKRTVTAELRSVYDRQHDAMVAAIVDRDPEAARDRTHDHLATVRDNLLGTV